MGRKGPRADGALGIFNSSVACRGGCGSRGGNLQRVRSEQDVTDSEGVGRLLLGCGQWLGWARLVGEM